MTRYRYRGLNVLTCAEPQWLRRMQKYVSTAIVILAMLLMMMIETIEMDMMWVMMILRVYVILSSYFYALFYV